MAAGEALAGAFTEGAALGLGLGLALGLGLGVGDSFAVAEGEAVTPGLGLDVGFGVLTGAEAVGVVAAVGLGDVTSSTVYVSQCSLASPPEFGALPHTLWAPAAVFAGVGASSAALQV